MSNRMWGIKIIDMRINSFGNETEDTINHPDLNTSSILILTLGS